MEPTDREVRALDAAGSQSLLAAVTDATAPTEGELHRLLARRPWAVQRRSRRPVVLGGMGVVLAGAAAVALSLSSMSGTSAPVQAMQVPVVYGLAPIGLDEPHALGRSPVGLGPSIAMSGDATVVLDQANEDGTAVTVQSGRARFEVDPDGAWRALSVRAADVLVQVHGTVFEVERQDDAVSVSVVRGRVSVTVGSETLFLGAGEVWTSPARQEDTTADAEGMSGTDADASVPTAHSRAPDGARAASAVGTASGSEDAGGAVAVPAAPAARASLVTEGSADSELAQVLALQRRGVSAVELLAETEAVLERHRGSGVGAEVELVRLQTLAVVDPARASLEMRDWLDANPASSRAPLVLFERASVAHRSLGRCASALGDYRVLAERTDAIGARAAAGAGLCALELGSDGAARRYLQDALSRGLSAGLEAEVRSALRALEE